MTFKELPKIREDEAQVYLRVDEDGEIRFTCTAEDPVFQAWVAEGNEPLPAENQEPQP